MAIEDRCSQALFPYHLAPSSAKLTCPPIVDLQPLAIPPRTLSLVNVGCVPCVVSNVVHPKWRIYV